MKVKTRLVDVIRTLENTVQNSKLSRENILLIKTILNDYIDTDFCKSTSMKKSVSNLIYKVTNILDIMDI